MCRSADQGRDPRPLNSKAKGELAELAFLHKAASLGFGVAKPYGENERYDFIVDAGERLWRVQVKSAYCVYGLGYRTLGYRRNKKPYKVKEIDFLVAYIAPRDIWYVIPVRYVATARLLGFYPSGSRLGAYFESYREALAPHGTGRRLDSATAGTSPGPCHGLRTERLGMGNSD